MSLAGPAIAVEPLLSRQFRALRGARGMKAADIDVLDELLHKQCAILRNAVSSEARREQLSSAVHATWARLSDNGRSHSSNRVGNLLASTRRTNSPQFRSWMHHDVEATLRAVTCPILLLVGSKDLQVDPQLNLSAARKSFTLSGHCNATTRLLPGLNHLFQTCATGVYEEYAVIEETMSPIALAAVRDWLRVHLDD